MYPSAMASTIIAGKNIKIIGKNQFLKTILKVEKYMRAHWIRSSRPL